MTTVERSKNPGTGDDEDDDEDYKPQDESQPMDTDMVVETPTTTSQLLTSIQTKEVDEAFENLFGYKWGTSFSLADDPEKWTTLERFLCQILGPSKAASLLQSRPGKKRPYRKQQQTYKIKRQTVPRPQAQSASKGIAKSKTPPTPTTAAGGVDQLLKQLAAPDKVSTVAKTSADWDQFKEKSGLGDKLEEQAESKNAYLKRQDFLTRVDHRKFELEKKERDRERVKRG